MGAALLLNGCFEAPALPAAEEEDADMCAEEGCEPEPDPDFCEECLELIQDALCEEAECEDGECEINLRMDCPIGEVCERGRCVPDGPECNTPMNCGPAGECEIPTCIGGVCDTMPCPEESCVDGQCVLCNGGTCPDRTCFTGTCQMGMMGAPGLCTYAPAPGEPCDDGDFCNGEADECDADGVCKPVPGNAPCPDDLCDEGRDVCDASPTCDTDCAEGDAECMRGFCDGVMCRQEALANGTPCGLTGTCQEGACVECSEEMPCPPAEDCFDIQCVEGRCVESPEEQLALCNGGGGECVDGYCQVGCEDHAPCVGGGWATCHDVEPGEPLVGYCGECVDELDCARYGEPHCIDGVCRCRDHADCGHLTVDGCMYADACSTEGTREARSTVGACNAQRCEAQPMNGPCRRETEGRPCSEGTCRDGACVAPDVQVTLTCEGMGWMRFDCDDRTFEQRCDFVGQQFSCPVGARFFVCCTGLPQQCGPDTRLADPEDDRADRLITVEPLNGDCPDEASHDQRCGGLLEAATTIRCAPVGPPRQ